MIGKTLWKYKITEFLGSGGSAKVWKAYDERTKREVAIKVLRDELASDPVFLARFRNEAQLQAKLSHPNVASVHALVQDVIEEVAPDHPLAHEPTEAVGEHREHGVDLALLDQRLEALRVGPILRQGSVSLERPA